MNAISAANGRSSPPANHVQHKPPKLQKRDTDSVLSSLLASLEPPPSPPESLHSVDPQEFDSQWESGYSDNDATPDLVPNKSRHFFQSGSSSSANQSSSFDNRKDLQEAANAAQSVNQAQINELSSISDNDNVQDNSNNTDDSSDNDDDDVDIDDEDVFDMLRDNSQIVIGMLNNTNTESEETNVVGDKNSTRGNDSLVPGNSLDATGLSDVPPPIPTTPLPSDDEEPPVKPPPRVESLPKHSANMDLNSKPVMNGTISGHGRYGNESEYLKELCQGLRILKRSAQIFKLIVCYPC